MNRQSRLHCVINLLSRHLYPTSFFFSSKTWFCLPSLGSINELMLWVWDPRPVECLPHVGHFCSDKDGGQSSIAVEQARNKLTAIMDSVIQLDTLGLLSLFFLFWMILRILAWQTAVLGWFTYLQKYCLFLSKLTALPCWSMSLILLL